MSTSKNDSDADSDSSECSNKFWTRQNPDVNESSEEQLAPFSQNAEVEGISKRRQTKMLLVSLIESFCRVHGDSPEANQRVFFLICQTLSSLGFIDAEFVDEMASVRTTFQSAFQKLFYTAVETVRSQEFRLNQSRMIEDSLDDNDNVDTFSDSYESSSSEDVTQEDISNHNNNNGGFNLNVQNSRYHNDFVEVSLLGRGGFASVYRARNKLDGIEYAIKRIRLGTDLVDGSNDDGNNAAASPYDKIFREIKHLARLEHRNVVRYYASWLEYTGDNPTPPLTQLDEKMFEDDEHSIFNGRDPTFEDDDFNDPTPLDMSHITFGEDNGMSTAEKDASEDNMAMCIPERHYRNSNNNRRRHSRAGRRSAKNGSSNRRKASTCGWILYIQMYLCPATLHDYIKHRNRNSDAVDPTRNIEIFEGILEGAAYIHSQGLIHRDLKPSNIFLGMPEYHGHRRQHWRSHSNDDHSFSFDSVTNVDGTLRDCMWEEKWVPKIGDFGLAAPAIPSPPPPTPECSISPMMIGSHHSFLSLSSSYCRRGSNDSTDDDDYGGMFPTALIKGRQQPSSGVGTRTYAAPEQLADPPLMYDNKVDVYSLGIILFELYQPFSTGMERACAIDQLKHGVFPDGFVEKYPKISALILWTMDTNPTHRPSASQLLEFELFSSADEDVFCQLQAKVEAQSAALDTKNREMEALRDKMKQLELDSKRKMDAMQRRVDELQQKLNESALPTTT